MLLDLAQTEKVFTWKSETRDSGNLRAQIHPHAMSSALDPAAILAVIPTLLPDGDRKIGNQQDAIAVLLHAVMSILGFRLVGLDDSSSDVQCEKNVLPAEWKKTSPDLHALRYKHDQSSLVFLLKIIKLSKRLVIHGIALGVRLFDSSTPCPIPTNLSYLFLG